jgi:hypothetical protein
MKPYAFRWMLVVVTVVVSCPLRVQAQAAGEYAITTSAVGTLGTKIGSALGGMTKQATPTLQQVLPNPAPPVQDVSGKKAAGKMVAEKETAGKAPKVGVTAASGVSTVQIDSTPSDAAISIDNVVVAHTPTTLTLAKGIHVIELSHDGFISWQKTILVPGGEMLSFNPALKDPKTSPPLFTVQR